MKDTSELRIAHISDLHFTSGMLWPPTNPNEPWAAGFLALRDDLIEQQPDLLMVTGDIADNSAWDLTESGLEQAWRNALSFLEELSSRLFAGQPDPTDHLFVIPGNHDAKVAGNVSRAQLGELTQSRWFRLARLPLGWVTKRALQRHGLASLYDQIAPVFQGRIGEALQALPSDSALFATTFARYMTSRPLPALGLFVFCVDSNVASDAWLNFAQGAVAPEEARRLRETAGAWEQKFGDAYASGYKVVLVHHHPMP